MGRIRPERVAELIQREVVEILTVKGQTDPFIPAPSARALAQAADKDDDIQEAYVNRAVYR